MHLRGAQADDCNDFTISTLTIAFVSLSVFGVWTRLRQVQLTETGDTIAWRFSTHWFSLQSATHKSQAPMPIRFGTQFGKQKWKTSVDSFYGCYSATAKEGSHIIKRDDQAIQFVNCLTRQEQETTFHIFAILLRCTV